MCIYLNNNNNDLCYKSSISATYDKIIIMFFSIQEEQSSIKKIFLSVM